MNRAQTPLPSATVRSAMWLSATLVGFVSAAIAGASLPGIRWLVSGNADPLNVDWPLYLQFGSLVLTLLVGLLSRRPFAAAFGLYLGLVAYMLVDGGAEYPVSSAIALAVHGLLPALAGAVYLVLFRTAVAMFQRGRN